MYMDDVSSSACDRTADPALLRKWLQLRVTAIHFMRAALAMEAVRSPWNVCVLDR
jgi:hypothetical protein